MYVFLECLTVVALIALFATVLIAGSFVLVALGQGINAVWRIGKKAAEPASAQTPRLSLALQPAILSSTEPLSR